MSWFVEKLDIYEIPSVFSKKDRIENPYLSQVKDEEWKKVIIEPSLRKEDTINGSSNSSSDVSC